MARMISFVVLILILVAVGTIFFKVMSGFLVPVFLAALLGVLFQPVYRKILERFGPNQRYVAAGVTTLLVAFIVLAPAIITGSVAVVESLALIDQYRDVNVQGRLTELKKNLSLDIPLHDDLRKIQSTLNYLETTAHHGETPHTSTKLFDNLLQRAERLADYVERHRDKKQSEQITAVISDLKELRQASDGTLDFDTALAEARGSFRRFKLEFLDGPYRAWLKEVVNPEETQIEALRSTLLSSRSPLLSFGDDTISYVGRLLFGAIIMIATLFFLFADGPYLLDTVLSFSPLEEKYVRELILEFDRATRAIVLATLLSALAQGVLAGFGYQFVGVGSVFLLTLLTMVFAMVPFLGAAAVWVSVCLYLYFVGDSPGGAIGLAIYGALVVSMADNVIKPIVLHGQSNLHPLLALLSILGGVQALGPIGILVGPMTVVFLQTLVRILHREYRVFARHLAVAEQSPREDSEGSPPEPFEPQTSPSA